MPESCFSAGREGRRSFLGLASVPRRVVGKFAAPRASSLLLNGVGIGMLGVVYACCNWMHRAGAPIGVYVLTHAAGSRHSIHMSPGSEHNRMLTPVPGRVSAVLVREERKLRSRAGRGALSVGRGLCQRDGLKSGPITQPHCSRDLWNAARLHRHNLRRAGLSPSMRSTTMLAMSVRGFRVKVASSARDLGSECGQTPVVDDLRARIRIPSGTAPPCSRHTKW